MPLTTTWDASYEAIPADVDSANTLGTVIRNLKRDIRERGEVDHDWSDTTNSGKHLKVTLIEQGADPSTLANTGYIYTKDVGGITELFYKNDAGTVKQITTAGLLNLLAAEINWAGQNILLDNTKIFQGRNTISAARNLASINAANEAELGATNTAGLRLKANAANAFIVDYGAGNKKLWHEGQMGTGSGLDADLLDGLNSTIFRKVAADFETTFTDISSVDDASSAHGLASTPKTVEAYLENTSTEGNWAVGDRVFLFPFSNGAAGFSIGANATNVYWSRGTGSFAIMDRNGGASLSITNNKWKLVVRAWL